LKEKTNWMLTEKKKKKTTLAEQRTHANPAAKPTAQTQTQRGMRECNRSMTLKKSSRSSIKQKEII
jgi:hypothetical protein